MRSLKTKAILSLPFISTFLYGGTHEQYHTPNDVGKIHFRQLQKRADFIHNLVEKLVIN